MVVAAVVGEEDMVDRPRTVHIPTVVEEDPEGHLKILATFPPTISRKFVLRLWNGVNEMKSPLLATALVFSIPASISVAFPNRIISLQIRS